MSDSICPVCNVELHDTDEPDKKICLVCGEEYWDVVGFSAHEE